MAISTDQSCILRKTPDGVCCDFYHRRFSSQVSEMLQINFSDDEVFRLKVFVCKWERLQKLLFVYLFVFYSRSWKSVKKITLFNTSLFTLWNYDRVFSLTTLADGTVGSINRVHQYAICHG